MLRLGGVMSILLQQLEEVWVDRSEAGVPTQLAGDGNNFTYWPFSPTLISCPTAGPSSSKFPS